MVGYIVGWSVHFASMDCAPPLRSR